MKTIWETVWNAGPIEAILMMIAGGILYLLVMGVILFGVFILKEWLEGR